MEFLTNFGIQPTLLLAQIVNFTIIILVLQKFFYKPIMKLLEDRKRKIEESLKNAQAIEVKLAQTEQNSAKILEESRANAQNIISEANKQAERIYQETSAQAKKLAEDTILEAGRQIERQRQEMQKSLEKETLLLLVSVVKKILGRNLKQDEKSKLTNQALSKIGRQIQ